MTRFPVANIGVVLTMLAAGCSPSAAAETYYDYATVLGVTPVIRTVYEEASEQTCRTLPLAHSTTGATGTSSGQGGSLTDIIRRDLDTGAPRTHRQCPMETVRKPRTETVGYRVRYLYGKSTYTRTMKTKPGERIRVRVELARR